MLSSVICIRDSLTSEAYFDGKFFEGTSIIQNYPYPLARINDWFVTNAGYSGSSAADWYSDYIDNYTYSDYNAAIIWLGTNKGLTDTLKKDAPSTLHYIDYAKNETGDYYKTISRINKDNPDSLIYLCTVL